MPLRRSKTMPMPSTTYHNSELYQSIDFPTNTEGLETYYRWLRENDLRTDRFVPVEYENGQKKPTESGWKDRQREHWEIDGPKGIVTGDGLAVLDDDSHKDGIDAPTVLGGIPGVRVSTMHLGKHIHIALDGDLPDCEAPEWGDIQTAEDLVIAPGTTFDHSECVTECGRAGSDTYTVTEISQGVVDPDDFPDVFVPARDTRADVPEVDADDVESTFDGTTAGRLGYAIDRDEKLEQLYHWGCGKGSLYGFEYSDRSSAECALAQKLLWWFEHDVSTVRDILDEIQPPKWASEGPGYRASVIQHGLSLTAGKGAKYEPDRSKRESGVRRYHVTHIAGVLGSLSNDGPVRTQAIIDSDLVSVGETQVRKVLDRLRDDGFVHYERDGRSGGWVIDELPSSEHRFFDQFATESEIVEQRKEWAARLG